MCGRSLARRGATRHRGAARLHCCRAELLKFVEPASAETLRDCHAGGSTPGPGFGGKICWCRRADSNRQPIAYEAIALPLSYCGVQKEPCSKLLSNKPPPVEEARSAVSPFVPAKAGTQSKGLDSRLRGNERWKVLAHQCGLPKPADARLPERFALYSITDALCCASNDQTCRMRRPCHCASRPCRRSCRREYTQPRGCRTSRYERRDDRHGRCSCGCRSSW